jgi:hypothetical protein
VSEEDALDDGLYDVLLLVWEAGDGLELKKKANMNMKLSGEITAPDTNNRENIETGLIYHWLEGMTGDWTRRLAIMVKRTIRELDT